MNVLATMEPRAPRFIATLTASLPDTEALVRIPLAITGRWVRGKQEFAITLEDLKEIARNFDKRLNREINVDYDHASEMPEVANGGPIPSAGRIVRLDAPEPLAPDDLPGRPGETSRGRRYILWGWYEPTPRARELIQNREYRYISPAIDWGALNKHTGKPQGATLTSVALTNRPFLEELPAIRLAEPTYHAEEQPQDTAALPQDELTRRPVQGGERPGGTMKEVQLSVVDGRIKITHDDLQGEYFADPKRVKKCLEELGLLSETSLMPALEVLAGRPGASEAECLAEIQRRLSERQEIPLAEAGRLLSEADARHKTVAAVEVFRAQVERELDEAIKAGKVLPKQREVWRCIALTDLPTFRKLMADQKPQVALRPVGFAGSVPEGVQDQVRLLTEQRARERNIPFGQALAEIGREHPDLVQQYRRAVSAAE